MPFSLNFFSRFTSSYISQALKCLFQIFWCWFKCCVIPTLQNCQKTELVLFFCNCLSPISVFAKNTARIMSNKIWMFSFLNCRSICVQTFIEVLKKVCFQQCSSWQIVRILFISEIIFSVAFAWMSTIKAAVNGHLFLKAFFLKP